MKSSFLTLSAISLAIAAVGCNNMRAVQASAKRANPSVKTLTAGDTNPDLSGLVSTDQAITQLPPIAQSPDLRDDLPSTEGRTSKPAPFSSCLSEAKPPVFTAATARSEKFRVEVSIEKSPKPVLRMKAMAIVNLGEEALPLVLSDAIIKDLKHGKKLANVGCKDMLVAHEVGALIAVDEAYGLKVKEAEAAKLLGDKVTLPLVVEIDSRDKAQVQEFQLTLERIKLHLSNALTAKALEAPIAATPVIDPQADLVKSSKFFNSNDVLDISQAKFSNRVRDALFAAASEAEKAAAQPSPTLPSKDMVVVGDRMMTADEFIKKEADAIAVGIGSIAF